MMVFNLSSKFFKVDCRIALGGPSPVQSINHWVSNRNHAAPLSSRAFSQHRVNKIGRRGFSSECLYPQIRGVRREREILLQSPSEEQIAVEEAFAMAGERIQVLNMEEYFSGDPARVTTFCENLREQCHTVGFFYVKNHGVPKALCDSILQLGREFFDLPSEVKMRLDYRNSAQFRGYMKIGVELTGENVDFREQLDLGSEEKEDFDIIDGQPDRLVYPVYRRLRGPNQWPPEHLLPGFKSKTEEYLDRIGTLSMHLMQAIALSLGQGKHFFDATFQDMPHQQLKIVRYPPKSESEDSEALGKFGVGEHSDSGFLSLLLQDDVGGLQAQTKAGEWTDVPPKAGTFVVNLGEMLQLATGGYYRATVHRVQSRTGSKCRYSIPFFFNPRLDTDITTLNMVANPGETDATVQNVPPLLLQDNAFGRESKTHGGTNKLLPVFGQNTFKSYARSHPGIVREHHADLLQFDGKLMLSKLEEL